MKKQKLLISYGIVFLLAWQSTLPAWGGGGPSKPQSEDKRPVKTAETREDLGRFFKFKQAFWTKVLQSAAKSEVTPTTKPVDVEITMVPFSSVYPGKIDLSNVYTPSVVPPREASLKKAYGFSLIRFLASTFLSVTKGADQGQIPNDHTKIQDLIFNTSIEKLFPRPMVPKELSDQGPSIVEADVFGAIAPASSLAGYLVKKDGQDDLYEMDLRGLEKYAPKKGKSRLGARVNLKYDPKAKKFSTVSIDYLGEEYTPNASNPHWLKAKKVAACGLATHNTLIKHLAEAHMLISGQFTGAILKNFKKDHLLRQILERHGTGAIAVNNYSIPNLIAGDNSSVPSFSNFNAIEIQNALRDHFDNFDIASMDVVKDGIKRGVLAKNGLSLAKDSEGNEINHPYMDMALKFWNLSQDYLHEVVNYIYKDDSAVANDPAVKQFYKDLNLYFKNGIEKYTDGRINKQTLVNLLSIYIHTASFIHENVGNITKNYNALLQYFPSEVNENGCNPSVNVAFRYLLTNALTDKENIQTDKPSSQSQIASLTDDVSEIVTSDPNLQKIMKSWRKNLLAYNEELKTKGLQPFVINPTRCQDAVNQ